MPIECRIGAVAKSVGYPGGKLVSVCNVPRMEELEERLEIIAYTGVSPLSVLHSDVGVIEVITGQLIHFLSYSGSDPAFGGCRQCNQSERMAPSELLFYA